MTPYKIVWFIVASLTATALAAISFGLAVSIVCLIEGDLFQIPYWLIVGTTLALTICLPGGLFAGVLFLVAMTKVVPRRYLSDLTAGLTGLVIGSLWYILVFAVEQLQLIDLTEVRTGLFAPLFFNFFRGVSHHPVLHKCPIVFAIAVHAVSTSVLIYRWVLKDH